MKLTGKSIKDTEAWEKAGYELPHYDRDDVARQTAENPEWLHFGPGNIFRAFPAALQQTLLDRKLSGTGIIVASGADSETLDKAYRPFDNLSLLVTLKADGTISKKVIGSVVESLAAAPGSSDWTRLLSVARAPSLRMISFTITEKGYAVPEEIGKPQSPATVMETAAALCLERYRAGKLPVALVSMDNCSHNGDKLKGAICAIAKKWQEEGLADAGFIGYLQDTSRVSFPWSMIDKITPMPDSSVRSMLEKDGYESAEIIMTKRKSYTASFVNAEETEYLVVEDSFPNGRPPLEKAGVIFTDRETVDRVEKMKVCTCLNPLHTALAIFGCLLSYKLIYREMKDPQLKALVELIGYREGLPVVTHPGIIDPKEFIDVVINKRLPNPFMPDTPQRIATDTSMKIPIRFGETIKSYSKSSTLDAGSLVGIPLAIAGWCRYLMGIDDEGKAFEPSPDPKLEQLRAHVRGIALGDRGPFHANLEPILSNPEIFGVNLYSVFLGEKIEGYFTELVAGTGAVRNTLKKHL